MFSPILITAHLASGVICDPWLPLEGILLYEACRRHFGGPAETSLPGRGPLDVDDTGCYMPTLPLLLIQDAPYRYCACSFAEWGRPYAEGRDHWNKRDDTGKHGGYLDPAVGRIETSKGRYKAYHMPVFYRVAPWVRWWAIGDGAEVSRLLQGVRYIGKKRAYGYGQVLRWQVEEATVDRSVFADGVPQRSVPRTERTAGLVAPEAPVLYHGFYPPYYDFRNQADCYMPPSLRIVEG